MLQVYFESGVLEYLKNNLLYATCFLRSDQGSHVGVPKQRKFPPLGNEFISLNETISYRMGTPVWPQIERKRLKDGIHLVMKLYSLTGKNG